MSDSRDNPSRKYDGPDRRQGQVRTDYKRRASDKREDFKLLRDKVLLGVGATGLLGVALSAVVIGVKDAGVAIAALGVFGGILGVPAAVRTDERRNDRNNETAESG